MKKWMERFLEPENAYRPKVRYWMPHGVVSEEGIRKDVQDLAERGFGSIEAVAMTRGLRDGFYTKENMWGSDLWLSKMNVLLEEAKKYNMTVDISNGPIWPIVDMRAENADAETTLYELAYGLKILDAGTAYNGEAPKPAIIRPEGTMRLIAVSLYKIVAEETLDFESYIALPANENVSVQVPEKGEKWALFAFWGRPSGHKNGIFYVADHFSETASKAVMDFWEEKIIPALKENLSVCSSIFCDSLEYRVDLEWTRTFEKDFEVRKGYSILPYLPVLGNEVEFPAYRFSGEDAVKKSMRNFGTYPPTNISGYSFSDKALQRRVNNDYFEMITYLFSEKHVGYMQKRAEKFGLSIRYQVAYGKTLETESAALYPAIPENEGLGGCCLDRYRNMAGAVHLSRKQVYSFECAAEGFHSYGQTHEDILWWMKRAYAGGINAQVLHGAHYCGYYDGEGSENGLGPGIDWPGFEGFTRRTWSNAWNRTLDKKGQKQVWDYLSRCNFLLQGVHKIDIAVYRNQYLTKNLHTEDGKSFYKDQNVLNNKGYTYEFLSPKLLEHENAVVANGVLDVSGAAYKALVLCGEEYLSYQAAEKILTFAKDGLPVLFAERVPDKCAYQSEGKTDEQLQTLLQKIPYVFVERAEDVPDALEKLGILPDVRPDNPCLLRPVHVMQEGADFYYVYNSNIYSAEKPETMYPTIQKEQVMQPVDCILSLAGAGDVYEIDGFSGVCTKISEDNQTGCQSVPLHFERDEAKILAVLKPEQAEKFGINGKILESYAEYTEIVLKDWKLQIKEILPPENRIGTFYESVWQEWQEISLSELVPWNQIAENLQETSGIGTYKTTFSLERLPKKSVLHIENACDTYAVIVNGTEFRSCDPALKETEITKALHKGENQIEIKVFSTLQNAASIQFLLSQGKKTKTQDYGIWGAVTVKNFL